MTMNKWGKRTARERAARTGEAFETAQRAIRNGEPEPAPHGPCPKCGPHPRHANRCQNRDGGTRCPCEAR